MSRIALLANPESGSGEAGDVAELLAAQGADVTSFTLDECDRAVGSGPQRIVVAGGDGSVACAAEAAGDAGIPLGVVPVGTANDFARTLDLPLEPRPAARLAVNGLRTRTLDLGRADQRPFVNAASAGLSPVAAREAHGLKGTLGPIAYAVGAVRAGVTTKPIACRVRCDGESLFSGRAWQVTIALTGAFGGGSEVEADPADGVLDAVVIEARSRARLVLHGFGVRAGGLEEQEGVRTGSGRVIEVETDGRTGFNIDGELVETDRVRLGVEPRAFEVVVG
jgi:diacylglycerol kinase (ATP)